MFCRVRQVASPGGEVAVYGCRLVLTAVATLDNSLLKQCERACVRAKDLHGRFSSAFRESARTFYVRFSQSHGVPFCFRLRCLTNEHKWTSGVASTSEKQLNYSVDTAVRYRLHSSGRHSQRVKGRVNEYLLIARLVSNTGKKYCNTNNNTPSNINMQSILSVEVRCSLL